MAHDVKSQQFDLMMAKTETNTVTNSSVKGARLSLKSPSMSHEGLLPGLGVRLSLNLSLM